MEISVVTGYRHRNRAVEVQVISFYITCFKGHKMVVVWVPDKNCYAFTCEECEIITPVAESIHGVIEIILHEGATLGRRIE